MGRYTKVYLGLWLVFSAAMLAITAIFVLSNLAEMLEVDEMLENEGLALSFLLLFFLSEVIGIGLATVVIDRVPWAYQCVRSQL